MHFFYSHTNNKSISANQYNYNKVISVLIMAKEKMPGTWFLNEICWAGLEIYSSFIFYFSFIHFFFCKYYSKYHFKGCNKSTCRLHVTHRIYAEKAWIDPLFKIYFE